MNKFENEATSPPSEGCPQDGLGKNVLTTINTVPIFRYFTPNLPGNIALRDRARSLRKAGNIPEVAFWQQVHKKKFHQIDFDRQRVIGYFIVDFYIKGLSLIIEIDGSSHEHKQTYDKRREDYLEALGLKIYRISAQSVQYDLDAVMKELEDFIIENYS